MTSILKLMPQEYLHVEDTNTCDVLTLVGPITFTMYDHHRRLHQSPLQFIVVPPGHYIEVQNPLHRVQQQQQQRSHSSTSSNAGAEGKSNGNATPVYLLLRSNATSPTGMETVKYSRWKSPYGSSELRFAEDSPFPLLPDEEAGHILPMPLLSANEALVLEAKEALDTADPVTGAVRHREQQEQYLYRGPGLYRPRLDEEVVRRIEGEFVSSMQVCYLTARCDFTDDEGVARVAGERWRQQVEGIFFHHPAVEVEVRELCVVADTEAVQFESTTAFYDADLNLQREAMQPYVITRAQTKEGVYVPRSFERLVSRRRQIHLSPTQYCVVASPVGPDGAPRPREAEVRVGKQRFTPQPGECVTRVLDALVVKEDEALLLTALQSYAEVDEKSGAEMQREGGSRWLVPGPRQYVPPIYARVVERRHVIKLEENSGVYVRNVFSGQVRSVFGRPFMLSAEEELWARPISAYVRRLHAQPRQSLRVDDMSADEIAEAAVEEGRANIRRTADLLSGAYTAVRVESNANPATTITATSAAGAGAAPHSNHEDEDVSDEEDGAQCGGDGSTGNASHNSSPSAAVDPYASTLDILKIAEQNAHPSCQSSDIAQYYVISANVEHNTLMRLYDTSTGRSRVVAGPATVYLEPHEHFTPLSLSGGRPKEPHQIHALSLYLGPDYMADTIEVETRDHARLRLHLAYNWEFDGVEAGSKIGVDAQLAFTIPDFVGQACKALASRVRSVVAGQTFEFFHCNSSTLIRQAIFTSATDGSTVVQNDSLLFRANGLRITTVDVQSVEPVDTKTRIALTKSVQLAVEIITKSQESDASHQAALLEQEAKGALELQIMRDRAKAEEQRTALLKVIGNNTVLEQAGASRAQALAESEARLAEAQGEVEATPIRCTAHSVGMDAELEVLRQRAELDLAHRESMNKLAIEKMRRLADIEATKYETIMNALGKETLIAIANAGPELKAQLLGALGLQGFVVTDGCTPINMLNFADQIASRSAAA
ncbi:major vault protein-like protein [Leptomonas pyrrhocoris]|uniref:Major vault protein-like protein n=1 Tax=Leptomonas pyrrhocoris TaxID=157538 RepID=A0A0M9FXS9_LEPPY|nr:major vault protein-like protein [Leptomonas pyrrhocoris]KPA78127.1 major vault protein-like protein [Leptomonas pyrrhocoris]|eukprot:XP_015656566.1 major vault protein-like protein [Leptomonas pyrrhocoris]